MPFDPIHYTPPRLPGPPQGPRLTKGQERAILIAVLIFCLVALLFPISADALVDLWRFAGG